MSPAGYHSNDEKWNNGYKESDTYIQQTIAFYYRLNKVSTSLDSDTGKEQHQTDLTKHQVGTHSCISHQFYFMSETSDKNRHNQRTSSKTQFHWSRYSRKCNRQTSEKDTT